MNKKKTVSINFTVENNASLVSSLIGTHAVSGCDSVPMMFGIGKSRALDVTKNFPLKYLGCQHSTIEQILEEGRKYVSKCYGMTDENSSKNR